MKRVHWLALGLCASLLIAAVAPPSGGGSFSVTSNNFNTNQFGLNGATNVYIKSGALVTNLVVAKSSGNALMVNTNVLVVATNNVGIGTATPSDSLHVSGGGFLWDGAAVAGTGGHLDYVGGYARVFGYNYGGSAYVGLNLQDAMFFNGGATASLIGIQTNAPAFQLDVNGTNRANYFIGDGGGLTNISASGTNSVTLNGTNVFTGTNTFPAAGLFPANTISRRLLFATNYLYIANVTATASVLTNSGDYVLSSGLFEISVPALLGSNSYLQASFTFYKTNANVTAASYAFYGGTNTNCFYANSGGVSVGTGLNGLFPLTLSANDNSHTSQYANQGGGGIVTSLYPSNYFGNTSASFKLFFGAWTTTTHTNLFIPRLILEEIVVP